MRRYYTQKTIVFRRCIAAFFLCIAIVTITAHYMLKQYADIVCQSSCSQYGERIINDAVSDALYGFDFTEILMIDDSGYFINSEKVNEISVYLQKCIGDKLESELHSYVSVPVGAFTGVSFLSGSGPKIKIDIYSVGSPHIELRTSFKDAGINQTLFELSADISVIFTAVMPSKSVSVTVERQVLLAQKVIIGDIPQLYFTQNE